MPTGPMNLSKAERRRRAQRANHARKFQTPEQRLENAIRGGAARKAQNPIPPPGAASKGGKKGLAAMIARKPNHQNHAGKRGGKKGGKIQGPINARIGWMTHIAFIRYGKSHKKCPYCIHHKVRRVEAA
jgi:hypothetical protein